MSLESKEFIGCSIDGLRDRLFAFNSQKEDEFGFFLADVILSKESFAKPLVGERAETSRTHSGLPWPQEARFPDKTDNLKRIPVPLCWRLLIDGGERVVTWNGQEVTRLLAFHFANRISAQMQSGQKDFCLAVPDGLSDLAQERLYKSLKQQSQIPGDGLMLVRRSVTSALAWLDKTQLEINDLTTNDHLLVVYLGPDAFEWSVLGLKKVKTDDGKQFIVPVRDYRRQSKISPYSGCDVLDSFVFNTLNIKDVQARWRLLTGVTDLWQLLNRKDIERKHSEVLFADGAWKLWEFDPLWKNTIWQSKACRTDFMKEIGLASCSEGAGLSWRDYLKNFLTDESLQNIRLRGVVFSGSILSGERSFVEEHLVSILRKHNALAQTEVFPKKDSVWFPDCSVDPLSQGAAIFSHRMHNNLPTYFDVIPQVSIYVSTRRGLNWRPLLKDDSTEIMGGRVHEEVPPEKLNLARGGDKVEGYLKRGEKIKKAIFSFSSPPKEDVELDVHLRLSAAKGLAEIELVPHEKYFLFEGQRIRLDFLSMEEIKAEDLPAQKAAYPYVDKLKPDLMDRDFYAADFVRIWGEYEQGENYSTASSGILLQELRAFFNRPRRIFENGRYVSYFLVDQDGLSGTEKGQKVIKRISRKMGRDFKGLLNKVDSVRSSSAVDSINRNIRHLFNASTWLNNGASDEIKDFLRQRLEMVALGNHKSDYGLNISTIVRASGRVIADRADLGALLRACEREVEKRRVSNSPQIERSGKFPSYWPRALAQILSLREYCVDELNESLAYRLASWADDNIKIALARKPLNRQRLFWNVTLLLYLLRARIMFPEFLGPADQANHQRIIQTIQSVKRLCKSHVPRLPGRYIEQIKNLEEHLLKTGSGNVPIDYLFAEDDEDDEE